MSYCCGLCCAAGVQSDSDSSAVNNKLSGQSSVKPNRPSLAKILLSLDGNLGKQQALSHVLSALQIMYARCVVFFFFFFFFNEDTLDLWMCLTSNQK